MPPTETFDALVTVLDDTRNVLGNLADGFGNMLAQLAQVLGVDENDPAFAEARQYVAEAHRIDLALKQLVERLR